jgi:hypothetical protein
MHRLTTWIQGLDSYASFRIHRRILSDVIGAKLRFGHPCSEELDDCKRFARWYVAFDFDERFGYHKYQSSSLQQISKGRFRVGPLLEADGSDCIAHFANLEQAFDCFFVYIDRHVREPFRLVCHPFKAVAKTTERIGHMPLDPPYLWWDDRHELPECYLRDWSDRRECYYDDHRNNDDPF